MVKMSRLETGIIKICQRKDYLFETLGGAVAAIVPKAEKKRIKIYAVCDESVQICHDRKWTEEAIFNVLDNAVKYTDTGGCIRISVDVQEVLRRSVSEIPAKELHRNIRLRYLPGFIVNRRCTVRKG